jgi:hypothetical protein
MSVQACSLLVQAIFDRRCALCLFRTDKQQVCTDKNQVCTDKKHAMLKTLARERDKAEIVRRLRGVRADSPRRWGRMSAHQMICHLCDSFRMAMGQKSVSDHTGRLPRAVLKCIALYAPLPWPPGIVTRPEVDQELGGTKPVDFQADVAQLQALLECFTTESGRCDAGTHPAFGRMSRQDWLRWGYLHTDHHLRQFGA